MKFTLYSIGRIRKTRTKSTIVLDKKYQSGLMGVENHSEIWVIWWFNRNDNPRMRSILKVHPRLARPDTGTMRIGGLECTRNPKAAQQLVGVVPDESNLYPELTGLENLCFCAALYGKTSRKR